MLNFSAPIFYTSSYILQSSQVPHRIITNNGFKSSLWLIHLGAVREEKLKPQVLMKLFKLRGESILAITSKPVVKLRKSYNNF